MDRCVKTFCMTYSIKLHDLSFFLHYTKSGQRLCWSVVKIIILQITFVFIFLSNNTCELWTLIWHEVCFGFGSVFWETNLGFREALLCWSHWCTRKWEIQPVANGTAALIPQHFLSGLNSLCSSDKPAHERRSATTSAQFTQQFCCNAHDWGKEFNNDPI